MKCHQCHRENADAAVFCASCGTNLFQSPPTASPAAGKLCPRCGAAGNPNGIFCEMCGATHGAAARPAMANAASRAANASRPWAIVGGIAAGTVASAATVGGAWWYVNNKPAGDSEMVQPPPAIVATQPQTAMEIPSSLPPANMNDTQSLPAAQPPQGMATSAARPPKAGTLAPPPLPDYQDAVPPPPNYSSSIPPPDYRAAVPPAYGNDYGNDYADDLPPPPLDFSYEPELVVAPSDSEYVYMAAGMVGLYFLAGEWFRYHNGHWFNSRSYNGRWGRLDNSRVPQAVRGVPPEYARSVGSSYQRVPFSDVGRNWRAWDQQRHWNQYNWYQHELRPDVRSERRRAIEAERRRAPTPAPVVQQGQRAPQTLSGQPIPQGQRTHQGQAVQPIQQGQSPQPLVAGRPIQQGPRPQGQSTVDFGQVPKQGQSTVDAGQPPQQRQSTVDFGQRPQQGISGQAIQQGQRTHQRPAVPSIQPGQTPQPPVVGQPILQGRSSQPQSEPPIQQMPRPQKRLEEQSTIDGGQLPQQGRQPRVDYGQRPQRGQSTHQEVAVAVKPPAPIVVARPTPPPPQPAPLVAKPPAPPPQPVANPVPPPVVRPPAHAPAAPAAKPERPKDPREPRDRRDAIPPGGAR